MIYLSSPYSHPDPQVENARFEAVCDAAASLLREGKLVYSPVAHGRALAARGLPSDWTFWSAHNRDMLARCDAVAVLALDGWTYSEGVVAELRAAREAGRTVSIIEPVQVPHG